MALALYRRYRPDTFEGVIGQPQVTVPLSRALDQGKLTHAYLFSGPRGCGKTSSARIFARCINCAEGPTSQPCGKCDSCRDLATGGPGSIDVVEIDAASHNGVDDARELRERAGFAPVRDRYKIFILDEAHMVTQQGFNALLKIVEEPPEHVMFMFATTEPDKVISTIRSRTHHYPFRLVPAEVMGPYLEGVCKQEKIKTEPGVLKLAMRAGGGSVRDTLSVLDQLMVGADQGTITYEAAVALLGYTPEALIDEAIDAVAEQDGSELYAVVQKVVVGGFEPKRFVEDILQRVRDLLVLLLAGQSAESSLSEDSEAQDITHLQSQAQALGLARLTQMADIVDETLSSMSGAISPRMRLELLAARLLVPAEESSHAQPAGSKGVSSTAGPASSPVQGSSQSGFIGSRRSAEAPVVTAEPASAPSQSVPSQSASVNNAKEQTVSAHENMTLDQRWDAVVAALPEGVQEYVVRQKVPTVAMGKNAKGRPVLSMTFDQPLSQHAFALAVAAQGVDGETKVPKIVMARARQEFGPDTMIAPSGVAANGEQVESVGKMSPERRSEVKKQIALARTNMSAMNLGFAVTPHTVSGTDNKTTDKGQGRARSQQHSSVDGAAGGSPEDDAGSDSDEHHPSNPNPEVTGGPVAGTSPLPAAGFASTDSYVKPDDLDDDDPWAHPQPETINLGPEQQATHSQELQVPTDAEDQGKVNKMGLPDLSDQDDPWAQPDGQPPVVDQVVSAEVADESADVHSPDVVDEAENGEIADEAAVQQGESNSRIAVSETVPQRQPEVPAEEDSYSLDDARQGENSLMGPQELSQLFDVKQVEDLAADDPRNPLNANKHKK
ncbi:DNA polymerase III subunit gamma and tau [Bombiscardovia coagulans]|uniref:DNA-directed DNA polymerase n=1 Tax=Bombiscardovia coagulans TaxID=686666 RepID=A0A261ER10_9BIFI|nr:DNA polymerase III subunit gamma and tau [Bombiscardovia coagulans]OZG49284.1 DNA polymerase III subunit gamma/tau [Bombiscardovia coagulans]